MNRKYSLSINRILDIQLLYYLRSYDLKIRCLFILIGGPGHISDLLCSLDIIIAILASILIVVNPGDRSDESPDYQEETGDVSHGTRL